MEGTMALDFNAPIGGLTARKKKIGADAAAPAEGTAAAPTVFRPKPK
jgi:hypothetical protein